MKVNEEDSKKADESKNVNAKKEIMSGLKGMRPGAVMQAIAKSLGTNSPKFLATHLLKLIVNAAKNGKIKASALKDAIKDFDLKNIEDNSGIDWDKVVVDDSGMTFKCLFDGDSKQKLMSITKAFEDSMKDVKTEVEEADKKLNDDVKKAGVKLDQETIDKDGVIIANVIDDKENKDKSGKELKKEIEELIKLKEELKKAIEKQKKESKKLEKIKIDPKIAKMSPEELEKLGNKGEKSSDKKDKEKTQKSDSKKETTKKTDEKKTKKKLSKKSEKSKKIDAIRSKLKRNILKKVQPEFKKSVQVSFIKSSKFKDMLEKHNFENVWANSTLKKYKRIAAVRVDYYDDEASEVIGEAYKVNVLTGKEKNKGLKKITDYIESVMKSVLGEKNLGKIYKYRKRWSGKNPDGNYDEIYVFAPFKSEDLNESIMVNESDDVDVYKIVQELFFKNSKNSGYQAGLLIKQLWPGNKHARSPRYANKLLEDFVDEYKTDPELAVKRLLGYTTDDTKKMFLAKIASEIVPDAKETFKDFDINIDTSDKHLDKLTSIFSKRVGSGFSGSGDKVIDTDIGDKVIDTDIGDKVIDTDIGEITSDKLLNIDPDNINLDNVKIPSDFAGIDKDDYKLMLLKAYELKEQGITGKEAAKQMKEYLENQDWFDDESSTAQRKMLGILAMNYNKNPNGLLTKNAIDAINTSMEADLDAAGISDGASEQFGKVKTGFASFSDGSQRPAFSFETMSRRINDLDDIFDDGKIDPGEYKKLADMGARLDEYKKWALDNAGSKDPDIQAKAQQIMMLSKKYEEVVSDNYDQINSVADEARSGVSGAAKEVQGKVANSQEMEEAKEEIAKKSGISAFTAIGWARLAAKTTGIILNQGKSVVDVVGEQAMKYKEDKHIIAELKCTIMNGDDADDTKFDDTKFSVRFDTSDFKWHATCLDNRKMKFPEDKLIKAVFNSETGKKFKRHCLSLWTSIFKPKNKMAFIVPFILNNAENIVFQDNKQDYDFYMSVKKVVDNFNKIEKEFK